MLGLEPEVIEKLFGEMYKGKEKLLDVERAGRCTWAARYAQQSLPAIGLRVERRDCVGDLVFVEGNAAAALGAVYGGATVCAWYPITPSSSLAEAFEGWCRKLRHDPETGRARYAIVQAEDELASIGMVIGAGWNGARAFTATSGPGISLMTEFLGLAYFAEIPATIVNVQRGGPSTGMPTRTQQADLLACAYAGHGDTKHVLLFPEDPAECFDFTAQALDLADRLQTPIFVMTDLDIGMNRRLCEPLRWDDERTAGPRQDHDEPRRSRPARDFGRYLDVDGDGIPYRTLPGTHPTLGRLFHPRHDAQRLRQVQRSTAPDYVYNMERLLRKFETAKSWVPQPVERPAGAAVLARASGRVRFGALQFGSTSPAMSEAHDLLEDDGIAIDVMRDPRLSVRRQRARIHRRA